MTATEFIQSLPSKAKPEILEGLETLFHFDIEGEGGGQFSVKITDGKMSVATAFEGEPKCVVKTKAETLLGVLDGSVNPTTAVMFGKIKVSNIGELMKYAKIFGLM